MILQQRFVRSKVCWLCVKIRFVCQYPSCADFKCLVHKSPLRAELVENADFICIRELTGGMYFGEKYQDNDKAYDTNMYTRPEIERILKVAFEYA